VGHSSEVITNPFLYIENAPELLPNFQMRAEFVRTIIRNVDIGAEIGVHKGQFSRFLTNIVQPSQLHLVDPWYLMGKEWTWAQGEKSTIFALTNIIREFEDELVSKKVVLHIGYDLDILPELPDSYFDWVYLDTSHRYDQTLLELAILSKKIKPKGVIIGDDWYSDVTHMHHGVYRAVKEFLSRNSDYEELFSSSENKQWALAKKKF
jgi:hypothetical protein